MMRPSLRPPVPTLALAIASLLPAAAQAPDCTGISGVFNTDPDLAGELTGFPIASGLAMPLFVAAAPGDNTRLFVVQQTGQIRIIKEGVLLAAPFLDIGPLVACCIEEGLLGLAFHPDYQDNGWFFVYHTNSSGNNVVARYTVSADPDDADETTRAEVITVHHPDFANHNGGMIAFSPLDGRLYIGTGDGGDGCDPGPDEGNAQSLSSNLGKLLRLDVDALPYGTSGNPFDGAIPGNDEIWSYGLRNPWRWSFDRITGAAYIGDVGQVFWEEIDCSPGSSTGGENYGWVPYEGDHCPNASCGTPGSCVLADYVPPIREYERFMQPPCAVMGGYVYRGCRMAALDGTYFYADLCDDFVRTFRTDAACSDVGSIDRGADLEPGGAITIESIVSFGEDNRGELYLVDQADGEIFKILPEIAILEVSGPGAPQLVVDAGGSFGWELLEEDTAFVHLHKVYRADGDPTGPFACVHIGTASSWVGGDPETPGPDQVFYYLITAQTAAGGESTAGARSDGTLRTVDTASSCTP
jgi:glucose/arabinose dehydrogenase